MARQLTGPGGQGVLGLDHDFLMNADMETIMETCLIKSLSNIEKPTFVWSDDLKNPPWRLLPDLHPEAENINKILEKSLEYQSSKAPMINGDDYIQANNSFGTNGLMYHYLKTFLAKIGTVQDEVTRLEFFFGSYTDPTITAQEYDAKPQCWLELNGQVIDNSFIAPEINSGLRTTAFQHDILSYRRLGEYVKEDLETTQKRLLISGGLTGQGVYVKTYKTLSSTDNAIEQYLAAQMMAHQSLDLKLFDILMRKYLKKEFDLDVVDLLEKWSEHCWNCGKKAGKKALKKCAACQFARYCEKKCQAAYRQFDKVLDCERRRLDHRIA